MASNSHILSFPKALDVLVPDTILQGTPWVGSWAEHDQHRMHVAAIWACIVTTLAFAIQLTWLDARDGLNGVDFFPRMRFLQIAVSLLIPIVLRFGAGLARAGLNVGRLCIGTVGVFHLIAQAMASNHSEKVPVLFILIIAALVTILMRLGALTSLLFFAFQMAIAFLVAGNPISKWPPFISSGIVVCVAVLMISTYECLEVRSFIRNKESIQDKQKIIELQTTVNEQIRAFLPAVIYKRFESLIFRGVSANDAINAVIEPREITVACIYSDVRGFTRSIVNGVFGFREKFLKDVRRSTTIIESVNGIPRLIGDLILAYFDSEIPAEPLRSALRASLEITCHSKADSKTVGINRYLIVTYGDATVGNIGGKDSAREITAIGNPVNLASRIDAVTKYELFQSAAGENRIILSGQAYEAAVQQGIYLKGFSIDVTKLGLNLREFEGLLWIIPVNRENILQVFDEAEVEQLFPIETLTHLFGEKHELAGTNGAA